MQGAVPDAKGESVKNVRPATKAGAPVETRWAMVYIDDQYDVLGLVIDT